MITPDFLNRRLTDKEKEYLFIELFDFHYEDVSEEGEEESCYVLYDQYWDEFNEGFKFETLLDFFEYAKHVAKQEGIDELQTSLKKLLNTL